MKVTTFSIILLFLTAGAFAQNIVINKTKEYRLLTWEDFDGKVNKESPFAATTYHEVNYKMKEPTFKGDTVIADFEVVLSLGDKSWVKKDKKTDYLLKHEQGHFDIAVICAREIMRTLKTTTFYRKDYRAKSYAVYFDTMKKYREMELLYDKETNHSINEAEQKKWNEFIDKEMRKE